MTSEQNGEGVKKYHKFAVRILGTGGMEGEGGPEIPKVCERHM